jgi:hypothetical protein
MSEIVNETIFGVKVVNSKGENFPDGMVRNRFIPIWTFFQFEPPTVTDETIITRNEIVNASTFKGRPAKTLLCTVVKSTIGFYYGQKLRFTQYELRYNVADWRLKRLDMASDGTGLNNAGAPAVGDPATRYFDQFATDSFSFLRV